MRFKLFFLLLLLVISIGDTVNAQAIRPVKTFTNDGISVASYDFKSIEPYLKMQNDTTYVVNFWATWCQPCVAELPNFEKLNAVYKSKKVKVILISLDMSKQIETNLIPFIKKRKLQSTVIHLGDPDMNAWINKVDGNWSGAIPATVIYSKDKRKFYEQGFTYEELEEALNNL